MPSFKGALLGSALLSATTVTAKPVARSMNPGLASRQFTNGTECDWDPESTEAWTDSGAGAMVDSWIEEHGVDDWLRAMDTEYHIKNGNSGLNCADIYTNHCPAPQGACNTWDHQPFYYIRHMSARVNSHYRFAHEKLQDQSILNLGSIGQMIQDFKKEVPDPSFIELLFRNLASAASLTGIVAGRAGATAGDFFNVMSALIHLGVNNNKTPEVPDYDALEAEIERYAVAILESTNDRLEKTLPALWGRGDSTYVDEMYDLLASAGLVDEDEDRSTNIARLLEGGEMMKPVLDSDVADALEEGIKDFTASVLGNILAGLHYMVVGVGLQSEEACGMTKGAVWLGENGDAPEACYYLVYRAPGTEKSETTSEEEIDLMTGYGLDLEGFYDNVRLCNNKSPEDRDPDVLYLGGDSRYPPCFFGVAYVENGGALDIPIATGGITNEDTIPEWVMEATDMWNEPREKFCEIEAHQEYPACQY